MSARARRLALGVLVLPVLLISVDMTVLGAALPQLSADLGPTGVEQLWIVDIYGFVLAGLLVFMGSLGDRIGRRRLLLGGAVVFGVASVVAAFSTTPMMLILARALLGVGGATLMPSTLSLIRTIFTEAGQRRMAIAVWSAAFSGGMAMGPVVGGWLLEHFWWGSVFLVNVPVLLVLLVAGPVLLPEARDPKPGRFDLASAVLMLAAVLPVVYAIKMLATGELTVLSALGAGAGAAAGVLFVRRQRKLTHPMLDLGLFANRAFTGSVLTNTLSVFGIASLLFLLPQHLQLVLGMSPLQSAMWLLPETAASLTGAFAGAQLAKRFSQSRLIAGGLLLAVGGFAVIGVDAGLTGVVVGCVLAGLGLGLTSTLTNDLVVMSAPAERAGAAAAVSETGYELGGALGTAVLGSVATAVYRGGLPHDAPAEARETLAAAEHTPGLIDAAREAFVSGLQVASWAAAVILLGAAIQAYTMLRPTNAPVADLVRR
ncbi:MFS transporter [Actinocrispum wychmicini]|uniref:DHA2 family multidrug resistance protein-like MFS transporter n=1 Tax=Actinocrispum wychmicini TaxID=1213861 RepID=A0A4R2K3D9_9PSEU|nr:MFS transporter [Actinocrispum wychmicini]TCO60835.1 DHA2 family multidrug resistance protein-like MFS transporter [Actinocrispum wychmicini]